MQFGVILPHRWHYASGSTIGDFAVEAEKLGYDSLWVTDHIFVPTYRTERGHIFYEALMTLAYVSSITVRCMLGTSVLALPPRNPVLVAKQVATLDALSGGRVMLGVGTGWIEEELAYMGAPWSERARMLDESIKVLKDLWDESSPSSFEGAYTKYEDIAFFPKPAQHGGPKLLVGGMTDASLRRAARVGDGWIPWAVTPAELQEGTAKIKTYSNGMEPRVVCMMPVDIGVDVATRYTGVFGEDHRLLSGTVYDIAKMVVEFRSAGLDHLVCSFRDVRLFRDDTVDLMQAQMRTFAREVMPKFRD